MGEARYNILVKFEQQRKMLHQFHGEVMMDAFSLVDFSDSLIYNPLDLLKR